MTKPQKKPLVPALRFPEFRDQPEWIQRQLGQMGELVSGLTYNPDDVREEGLLVLRSSNVQNGVISLEDNVYVRTDVKGANLSKTNDILICVRNGSKLLIGKNALIPEGLPLSTHGAFMTVFRSDFAKFVFQLFQTSAYEKQVSADLGATINSINGNQLKKYKFHIPESKDEQQKIADCLSSIDDLITAQAQKLATLKEHKKGLMQQLFPAEGETVPKLRFPEFRDAGEWVNYFLVDIASEKLSNGVFNDPDKVGHGFKLINVIDMYVDPYIDETKLSLLDISDAEFAKNKVLNGDIFFTRSSLVKEGIAQSSIYLGNAEDVTFDGHLIRLRPNKSILNNLFLHYALKSSVVRHQLISKGKTATMTTIGQSDIAETKIQIPEKDEQQKIADCLSSVDALITAQGEKVEALKEHKKGLMQQLFPSMDEGDK